MKYLITGATGFIGKSILERLADHEILTVGREWNSDSELPVKINKYNPDYIIHCAAEIKNSEKTFESNILMTNWLLNVTKDIDYVSFVNIGSSSEYGNTLHPMTEIDLLKPRTMYEATKGACTLLCQGFANEYNKPIATVRPFSVYGTYEPAARLIPTLFRNFKNNVTSKISTGVHDFIHINDFIDGVFSVLYCEPEIMKGDIVHFGSGVQYSNVEVYNIIKKLFNSNLEYDSITNIFNKYDVTNWVADITYAKTKYKFNPKYNLQTGLTEIYEQYYK
jgi:nucleoside-diphosphate-sugar epimerase